MMIYSDYRRLNLAELSSKKAREKHFIVNIIRTYSLRIATKAGLILRKFHEYESFCKAVYHEENV